MHFSLHAQRLFVVILDRADAYLNNIFKNILRTFLHFIILAFFKLINVPKLNYLTSCMLLLFEKGIFY